MVAPLRPAFLEAPVGSMVFQFLAALVLLLFAFKIVNALITIPAALLVTVAERNQENPAGPTSWFATQIMVSLALAVVVGVFVAAFVRTADASPAWLYGGLGFVATYLTLASNAVEKERHVGGSVSPDDYAVARGAGVGLTLGLPAYLVLFFWPELILALPGMTGLFVWVFSVAAWLMGFWIVRLVLFLVVANHLLRAGFLALIAGEIAFGAVFGGLRRRIGSNAA